MLWAQSPGGVSNNLQIWVKADAGTATTTDHTQVSIWENQRTGGANGIANQGIPGYYADPGINARPVYRTAETIPAFNFNPAIEIVSTNGYRSGYKFPSGFPDNTITSLTSYTHLSRTAPTAYRTVFVMNGTAQSSNTSEIAGIWQSPFFGTQTDRPEFYNEKEYGDVYFGTQTISTVGSNVPSIQSYYNEEVGGSMKYFFDNNGLAYGEPSNSVASTKNYPGLVLLMDNDGGSGSTSLAGDRIGEFILYSETQTAEERQRVNSYLAIKYGVTLSQPQNYLSSDQAVTWNSAVNIAFNHNIFGLAKDDMSVLNQTVSNSINEENNIMLTVATTNDFISPNVTAGRTSFSQDKTFLVIGDNNVQDLSLVNVGVSSIKMIKRIWLAQKTNDTGSVWLQADLSKYTDISSTDNIYMMIADDAGFTQNVEMISPASLAGSKAVFNYSFPENKYFTFGMSHQAYCTKDPATGTPDAFTRIGITGQTNIQNGWPGNVPNGFIALESKDKGMVITRTTSVSIAIPVEGMLIYDTADKCFKLYNGTGWHCITRSCND
ncbi:hypothetical protein C1637_15540 [Chryseobacterium lactis]|uniref:DUF8202 domain-containing protein n=2 Tax=Chryseobacterium lactis TaxID=1241981 RepID=A0A3G6RJ13_CHRLC|nr:hypothetical protein EG342_17025 [Chryseobacterium lactis]AZB03863.1 hypothetical protein EG341_07900 [Chryseobacterium lactis]PNW13227.1 hypothetical protein C1637_15540 [Chryseobacterium lactis]